MEAKMKTLLPALLLLMTLTACETVEGLGRDVQTTGEVITQESKEAQVGM
jgi:entericidin B